MARTNDFIIFKDQGSNVAPGECDEEGHKEWIEVLSYSWGVSMGVTERSSAGSGTYGKANVADFTFQKEIDAASDNLYKLCCDGDQIAEVTFEALRADKSDIVYLKMKMEQVYISNVSMGGGGGGLATESVSLNPGKVTYTYQQQDKKSGELKAGKHEFYHDLTTNKTG